MPLGHMVYYVSLVDSDYTTYAPPPARVYGHKTTAVHDMGTPLPPPGDNSRLKRHPLVQSGEIKPTRTGEKLLGIF